MTDAFYVYAYFRLDGSPCYIGKGKGDRWRHRGSSGRNLHFLRIRDQAKAIGKDLPCEKLIEGLSDQEALDLEAFLIAAIGRECDGNPLVNLSVGGDRGPVGYRYTPEQSEAHGARRRGKRLSSEWCAAISASLKGKPKSAKHAAAAAAAQRGGTKASGWWSTEEGRAKQKANNHGRGNNPHSKETIETIRRASIRQHASAQARKCVLISNIWAAQNSCRYQVSAA
jgi:hypothetical protein